MVKVPENFSKLSSDEQYDVVDSLIKEMDSASEEHAEQDAAGPNNKFFTCDVCYAGTPTTGSTFANFCDKHGNSQNFVLPTAYELECSNICTASGLSKYAKYSLPSWAVCVPPMNTCPAYPGPTVCGPNGLPSPILRYKTLDSYLPRMVHGMANAFGYFPSNCVMFTPQTAKKMSMAFSGYARCSNTPLNQYIGCFQNQWLFFVSACIALTPAPLQKKAFTALHQIMDALDGKTFGIGNPYKICLPANNPCADPCPCVTCNNVCSCEYHNQRVGFDELADDEGGDCNEVPYC